MYPDAPLSEVFCQSSQHLSELDDSIIAQSLDGCVFLQERDVVSQHVACQQSFEDCCDVTGRISWDPPAITTINIVYLMTASANAGAVQLMLPKVP